MNITNFEQYDRNNPDHTIAMAQFGTWSLESGSMLPLTLGRAASFPLSILGFAPDGYTPLTHAAITSVNQGIATIGGYITNPQFRGFGLGRASLENLVETAPIYLGEIAAFRACVNETGLSQFEALGEIVVSERLVPVATGCNYIVEFAAVSRELNLLH